jgi:hypothetical protein
MCKNTLQAVKGKVKKVGKRSLELSIFAAAKVAAKISGESECDRGNFLRSNQPLQSEFVRVVVANQTK